MCKTYDIKPDCISNFDETDVQFAMESRNTICLSGGENCKLPKSSGSGRTRHYQWTSTFTCENCVGLDILGQNSWRAGIH
eukprot:scaffold6439_cov167-Amphora_coffeaeformis.AAC.1